MKWITSAVFFSLLFALPAKAMTPNDTFYSELWYLPQISAESAWENATGSDGVVVAVLDAGIDLDHPDLVDNIWINSGEIAGNGLDDDGNGFVDDVYGWDFVDNDNSPVPETNSEALAEAISHGTVVSGIIGATGNNSQGTVGLNWQVKIMSLRMLNYVGVGDSIATSKAIDYAVANGADVINLSFSGDTMDTLLSNSIEKAYEAGVVIVAAMGNDNLNTDSTPIYPACFGAYDVEDWVIGVAATTKTDEKTSFSNFGSACVDLSAPGVEFFGLSYFDPPLGFDRAYGNSWSGTSMAAPVVSGTVALILSDFPNLSPAQIRTILKLSVDPVVLTSQLSGKMGAGRINVARALEVAGQFSTVEAASTSIRYISGESFSTVYAVDETNSRYVFTDSKTFFTYEDSFQVVEKVPDSELSEYPLAGVALPKAGVVLV
ncbi:S8 family serine peptidase, partial [Patescibacteria group bacterium]|nr:S8 family serine peptidase [Patescibacteria group bacterium]